jgi:hypothetical protein
MKHMSKDYVIQRWSQLTRENYMWFSHPGANDFLSCDLRAAHDSIREFIMQGEMRTTAAARAAWYSIPAVNAAIDVGRHEIRHGVISIGFADGVKYDQYEALTSFENEVRSSYMNMSSACREANETAGYNCESSDTLQSQVASLTKQVAKLTAKLGSKRKPARRT